MVAPATTRSAARYPTPSDNQPSKVAQEPDGIVPRVQERLYWSYVHERQWWFHQPIPN